MRSDLLTCPPADYVAAYHADWLRPDHAEARRRGRAPLAREFAVASAVLQFGCATVLDVGCGEGHLAGLMASQGLAVGLVDCVEDAARVAAERVGTPAAVHVGMAEAVLGGLAAASFDAVTCCEMVEHVQDPARLVAHLARVARRVVVLTTPVGHSYDDPLHLHHWGDERALFVGLGLDRALAGGHAVLAQIPSAWGDTGRCWMFVGVKA